MFVGLAVLRAATLIAATTADASTNNTGTAADISTNNLELIPDKPSLWTESLLWDKDVLLRAGLGYKDNVLLSSDAPRGSPFFTSGLDLLLFRLPLDGLAFNLTATGDDVQYWRKIGNVTAEDSFLANAQVQKPLGEHWRIGLELKYTYVDQVAQELTPGSFNAVVAKGHTLGIRPFVRRDLGTNWWAQLDLPETRDWMCSPLDDDWKLGAQATLGRAYGRGSQVAITYGGFYIPHNEWQPLDATETPIPGEKLAVWRQMAELKWEHRWDKAQHWRSITKLGFQYDQDNGAGFYNYSLYSLSEELHFSTANWEIKGGAGVSYYDFPALPAGTNSPSRTLNLLSPNLTLRVERRIYKTFRLFGAYEYERVRSNQADSQYTYNIFSGGLSWEF